MKAKDVMTTVVVTVMPDTPVQEIAEQLLARHISGVPVIDAESQIVGIVSEGDLLRRPENDTEYPRSWWLGWVAMTRDRAADYLKTHGLRAEQVMTRAVVTITEETPLAEAAKLLEKRHIKRVPVVREGKLVGIVSSANFLHGLAAQKQPAATTTPDDQALREQISAVMKEHGWPSMGNLNVIVSAGTVELWGMAESAQERQAIQLAAERIVGVNNVENHLGVVPPYLWVE